VNLDVEIWEFGVYLIGNFRSVGIWNLKRIGTLKFERMNPYLVGKVERLEFGICRVGVLPNWTTEIWGIGAYLAVPN